MYSATGNALSIAANRISYLLDTKGPSMAVDTACSSSLVALDLARQSLQCGESAMAIVGGVNLILSPEPSLVLARRQMLAPDGKCKVFDASANGYVRGEGCGVVVLKRLPDAVSAGDRIAGVILASTVNQDGRTNGLTAPNGPSQQAAIRQALRKANVGAEEIGYFEIHGTGTALGDAIEAESLASVFAGPVENGNACFVGSLKANVGHLEPAAGIASLIKTLLALEKGEIPPQIHVEQINPQISLEHTRLRIPRRLEPWPRHGRRRVAAVNSFGFGGTNVTAVVAEAPEAVPASRVSSPCRFRRERFWFDDAERPSSQVRPLIDRKVDAPIPLFELLVSTSDMPYLADHVINGQAIFPAAAYLEMTIEALMEHSGEGAVDLTHIVFSGAMRLDRDQKRTVQILIEDQEDGSAWFRIFSRDAQDDRWVLHARGRARPLQDECDSQAQLEDARSRCAAKLAPGVIYDKFANHGLQYGAQFRCLREVWTGRGQALARVAIDPALEVLAGDFSIHPTFLDGCLQVLGPAALSAAGGTFLPVRIDRFRWRGGYLTEGWAHGVLTTGANAIRGEVRTFHSDGRLAFELLGVSFQNVGTRAAAPEAEAGIVYELQWEPAPRIATTRDLRGRWIVAAEPPAAAELIKRISDAGADCEASTRPANAAGIIYLASGESDLERSLEALQAAATAPVAPEVWLVTLGAQSARSERTLPRIEQSPIWGLGRTFRQEHPGIRCTLLDLDPDASDWADAIVSELRNGFTQPEIMLRDGVRLVPRLVSAETGDAGFLFIPRGESYALTMEAPGSMESLVLAPERRISLGPGEVEIRVRAAGMNFSDVMKAMGIYPGSAGNPVLGAECCGTVERVGEGVGHIVAGDEVMAVAPRSFSAFARTTEWLVVRKPEQLRAEEAAGVPVAFLTAAYGLYRLARIGRGERVLIHSASGGVGLAAVQLARRAGAEVLATSGNAEKRAFLRSLGIEAVFDSRSEDFAARIREYTNGYGVDVVLNSLSGDAMTRSLELLAPYGRFLEIGKSDIYQNGRLPLEPFQRAISYFAIDLDRMFRERPELMRELLVEIAGWFESGEVKPLPLRVFPIQNAREAFRHMAQAKHIGKIVLSPADPVASGGLLRRDGSYLITGGLGALGLRVARWMAGTGAGRIVLVGRSEPSPAARDAISTIREAGVEVIIRTADVSDAREVEQVIAEMPESAPLRGVVHAAGVLADATLAQSTPNLLHQAMAPKAEGAWNLHRATRDLSLDFFVLFSSLASVAGSPGQGGYSAANAFLDAMAAYRRSMGLPALVVNWGPWAGEGMAAGRGRRFERMGLGLLEPARALRVLEQALEQRRSGQLIVAAANLAKASASPAPRAGTPGDLQPEDRRAWVEQQILRHIGRVSGISPERIDRERNLGDLGIDSLTALELMTELEKTLQMKLPVSMSAGELSVSALSAQIARILPA